MLEENIEMTKQRFFALCLIILLPLAKINAFSVVFQVFQNDRNSDLILETTQLLSQGLLDSFFDFGWVACDAPASVFSSEQQSQELVEKVLVESAESFMDYLVVIRIDYEREKLQNPEAAQLAGIKNISWKAIDVLQNEVAGEGSMKPSLSKGKNKAENIREVSRFATAMAKEIKKGLNK